MHLITFIHPPVTETAQHFQGERQISTLSKSHVHFSVQYFKTKVKRHQKVHANLVWSLIKKKKRRWSVVRACKACTLVSGLEHMCSSILRRVFLQVCLSPEAGSKAERVPADQITTDESRSPTSLLAVAFNSYTQHVCLHWGQTVLYVQATVSTLNNLTALSNKRADTLTQASARLIPLHQKLIGRLDPRTTHTHTHRAGEDWRVHTYTCASRHSRRTTYKPVVLFEHHIDLRCN